MDVTRRAFLKGAAATGLGAVLGGTEAILTAPPSHARELWPTQRADSFRTGSVGDPSITLSTVARLAPGAILSDAPTVPGTEPVGSDCGLWWVTWDGTTGRLWARDFCDNVRWNRPLPGRPFSPTLFGGLTVYAGTKLRNYDPNTGVVRWSVTPPAAYGDGGGFGGLGNENGKLLLGAGMLLSLIRISDGKVLKTIDVSRGDLDSNGGSAPMIDDRDTAWYSYKFLDTLAVPPSTVDPITTPRFVGNGGTIPMLAPGRRVVIGTTSNGLLWFDQTTGAKHVIDATAVGRHKALATDGTRIFDVSQRGGIRTLRAYDIVSGTKLWERSGAVTAPVHVNRMVFVGEDTAGMAAYRATDGAEVWRYPGTARGSDPIVLDGGLNAAFSPTPLPAGRMAPLCPFFVQ
jgi:outer membrane protein assembly factor BamB